MNELTKNQAISIKSINNEIGMSSLRIAEITGKEHSDVLKTIRETLKELKIDQGRFSSIYLDTYKRDQVHFILPEREFTVVISGYSIKYRMALIDELISYKRGEKKLTPMEIIENAMQLAHKEVEKEKASRKRAEVIMEKAKLIEYANQDETSTISMATLAHEISDRYSVLCGRNTIYAILRNMSLIMMDSTEPTQRGLQNYLSYTVKQGTRVFSNQSNQLSKYMLKYLIKNPEVNDILGNPFAI